MLVTHIPHDSFSVAAPGTVAQLMEMERDYLDPGLM